MRGLAMNMVCSTVPPEIIFADDNLQAEVMIDQDSGRLQRDWGSLLSTLSMQDVARLVTSTEDLCAERT